MIDFKTWRQLNESFGFNLGVASPSNLGGGGIMGAFQYLDEKKKSKKHMDADVEVDDKDMDVESDPDNDEVIEKDGDEGCDKMMMSKKKSKKKMKNECACDDKKGKMGMKDILGGKGDLGGMDMGGDDMGDEEGMDMGGDDMDDVDDEDMENAEEESGEDLDGDGEMGEPEEHLAKIKSKKAPMPLGFMKKKMKKENTEAFLTDLQNGYISPKNKPDTDEEFWSSMKGYHYDPKAKFNDGFTELKEDMLLPQEPVPAVAPAATPAPGEVGFAPQQRLDANYQLPPLEEGKKPQKSWF